MVLVMIILSLRTKILTRSSFVVFLCLVPSGSADNEMPEPEICMISLNLRC
jgi:hypothetical protein